MRALCVYDPEKPKKILILIFKKSFNLVHPIMLTDSIPSFLSQFPLLINPWENKTFDKILTQECREKKVN